MDLNHLKVAPDLTKCNLKNTKQVQAECKVSLQMDQPSDLRAPLYGP